MTLMNCNGNRMLTWRNCNGNKAAFCQRSVHLKELFLPTLCCSHPCTDNTILRTNLTNALMYFLYILLTVHIVTNSWK